jgi:O-acetyl-ADP-ribose deacetylase (regulator of RNase III)
VIEYTQGDILAAEAEALVNTVNCVGVMGRGIALHFKHAYPANFKAYAAACRRGEVKPGQMLVFETGRMAPRWIINFPTKRHWRGKSRIEDIQHGMDALVREIRARDIRSIAIPPLGSGLGGLSWQEVRPIIDRALAEVPELRAIVFEPGGGSPEPIAPRAPKMTAGRAALVGLIRRYLTGMMDTSISLLEIHKLMYFLQEAGEPLRLRYAKALYGPYADNLRHVLQAVNGHLIGGYTAGGDAPDEQVTLMPGAVERAEAFLASHPETEERFDRVSELVDGYETPFGLELLGTAHWVATKEPAEDAESIIEHFYAWGSRKAQFEPDQVELALARLQDGGWVEVPTA